MKAFNIGIILLISFCVGHVNAQDFFFTHYYQLDQYYNPSFSCQQNVNKLNFTIRNQWPTTANYMTQALSYTHHFDSINGSVGLIFLNDHASKIDSRYIYLDYSQNLKIKNIPFTPGIQVGYIGKNIPTNELFGYTTDPRTGQTIATDSFATLTDQISNFDIGLHFSLKLEDFDIGYSVKHLNKPNLSFGSEEIHIKPIHFFSVGYTVVGRKHLSFSPVIMYLKRGTTESYIIKAAFGFKNISFEAGLTNGNLVILGLDYNYGHFNFSYVYDKILATPINKFYAHEIGISYYFGKTKIDGEKYQFFMNL